MTWDKCHSVSETVIKMTTETRLLPFLRLRARISRAIARVMTLDHDSKTRTLKRRQCLCPVEGPGNSFTPRGINAGGLSSALTEHTASKGSEKRDAITL